MAYMHRDGFRQRAAIATARVNVLRSPMAEVLWIAGALLLLAALAAVPARASGYSQPAFDRAYNFLQNRQNAITILGYVHFGADYFGHEYQGIYDVVDAHGTPVPGEFALAYRFHWTDGGVTDIAFLCNPQGQIYKSQVRSSNAEASQPFGLANLFISVVGNLLIDSNKKDMSREDLELARDLIDHADAHGLLDLWLRLEE